MVPVVVKVYLKDRLLITLEIKYGICPQPNELCHLHDYCFLHASSVYGIGFHISSSQNYYSNSVDMYLGV
jgi:hypothetical protein